MLSRKTEFNRLLMILLSIALILTSTVGCSSSRADSKISVFAAAGAKPALDELCQLYTEQYKVAADITYGGGGEILSKMILAKKGDVFVAPEQKFIETAAEKQAIDPGTIGSLAYMIPVIAVPKGNPKNITCLSDMAKPGVRVAITRAETTLLGRFAPEIFEKAGLSESINKNIVTTASDPNNLLNMLFMGQVDVGIIWNFYGTSASDKIEIVFLAPEQLTGTGQIQAAMSAYSKDDKLARGFIDFLTSSQSKEVFKKHGYIADSEEVKKYCN